jgi:beta-lactamase class A
MPSFRVTMIIGALQTGSAPASVLPTAAAAAAELTTVEASDLTLVKGSPRVTVRFTADDAEQALGIGRHVVETTRTVAEPVSSVVTERVQGSWVAVR